MAQRILTHLSGELAQLQTLPLEALLEQRDARLMYSGN
jgi:hypothetical protein